MANPIYENAFNEFKPVARIGEYVALRTPSGKEKYFKVVNIEPVAFIGDLMPLTGLTSIPPQGNATITSTTAQNVLAVDTDILLHYRLIPQDDFWYAYEQYGRRMQLKNVNSWLGKFLVDTAPNLLEYFVYEDNTPQIDIYNPSTTSSLSSLTFMLVGFTYRLEEQMTKPQYITYIPIYAEI